jgi:hypothetical protein
MKKLFLIALAAPLLLLPGGAKASIVQASPFFLDLGAEGFGDAHRLLTLQTTPLEVGSTVAGPGGTTTLTGDAVSGADKSAVANAGTLGWLTGANVGIGLNTNQTGNSTGLAVNAIDLSLYTTTGALIQTFSLATPFTLTAAQLKLQQGNGNAVFNFGLDAIEQAQFTADLLASGGASNVFVGLGSSLGCTSGSLSCQADDGADSFLAFNQVNPVPLPATAQMFLGGLLMFGGFLWVRNRKERHGSVSMLATA